MPSSPPHSARLDLEVLEHRLDHEVGVGGRGEVVGRAEPGERRVAILGGEPALGDGALEVAGDPVPAGLGPRELRLVEDDLLADGRVDLGDPVAHQPGAATNTRSMLMPRQPTRARRGRRRERLATRDEQERAPADAATRRRDEERRRA